MTGDSYKELLSQGVAQYPRFSLLGQVDRKRPGLTAAYVGTHNNTPLIGTVHMIPFHEQGKISFYQLANVNPSPYSLEETLEYQANETEYNIMCAVPQSLIVAIGSSPRTVFEEYKSAAERAYPDIDNLIPKVKNTTGRTFYATDLQQLDIFPHFHETRNLKDYLRKGDAIVGFQQPTEVTQFPEFHDNKVVYITFGRQPS